MLKRSQLETPQHPIAYFLAPSTPLHIVLPSGYSLFPLRTLSSAVRFNRFWSGTCNPTMGTAKQTPKLSYKRSLNPA
ncbi:MULTISPECIES: hypothetical protein [Cyanophyceae]|uniref:hypothetical protein n=1 Tax=Cyanophyceae TaxID=3028117 RepID=UPI001685B8F8|nr:hypothetical protein [Trichocoleus sp. FACHB-69]MBD1935173.1 hypothetical protein [Trichocoleus sp. FACHB-69]